MTFNLDKFDRARFAPRTEKVAVESLASFFADDTAPEWEVRGLSAAELNNAMEAGKRQHSIEAIVKAMAQGGDQVEAVRKALGLSKDTPGEIAKRLEMLVSGSVNPTIKLPTAVKLAECFPIEFLQLTNKVTELTGKGAELVKPTAASQTIPA